MVKLYFLGLKWSGRKRMGKRMRRRKEIMRGQWRLTRRSLKKRWEFYWKTLNMVTWEPPKMENFPSQKTL